MRIHSYILAFLTHEVYNTLVTETPAIDAITLDYHVYQDTFSAGVVLSNGKRREPHASCFFLLKKTKKRHRFTLAAQTAGPGRSCGYPRHLRSMASDFPLRTHLSSSFDA